MVELKRDEFEEFAEFLSEFRGESDRAAVVLGAARLDILLDQLLKMHLKPSTGNEDELFDGDSPLSSFHAKTNLAYRLGLIDAIFVRALNLTRKIRNVFAHEGPGCDIRKGGLRDRVKELKKLFGNDDKFEEGRKVFFPAKPDPSGDFRIALALMTLRLEKAVKDITRAAGNAPLSLIPPDWGKQQ
ncbi:MAG TPA: hypothetical protein P5119_12970 [Candidatus Aminicenantes bacterium]|nr:hypothetical protein [Candidatus Aminicenantes bacterium]HRY66238.1 hypothetical protein [Candidatus Aminicenantes bacterium]HRZ73152.1 hypothetical protein [Candidatus Aminicenantes bacterium]